MADQKLHILLYLQTINRKLINLQFIKNRKNSVGKNSVSVVLVCTHEGIKIQSIFDFLVQSIEQVRIMDKK